MALILQAQRTLRTRLAAQALEKNPYAARTGTVLRLLRDVINDMKYKRHTLLSEKQRLMCMKILGLTTLPPAQSTDTPEVLKNLPKKPPHRRHEE
jgi:hypothetical protein